MDRLKTLHRLHDERTEGKITTVEICRNHLERIDAHETEICAFLTQTRDELLKNAEFFDEKIKAGKPVDVLAGMPIAVKDILITKGIRTTCGSQFLSDFIPPYESTVTQKLKDCGYNLIGKTNMDEFAMGSSNENSAFRSTKNPISRDRVPGGSSGGSAACVAAGFALAAIGTDTGGSIRQPAGFCGITGLKPSYGRVSRYGLVAYGSSLDQAGPMTLDVEDAAILLQTISGYDPHDNTSANLPVPNYCSCLNQDIKGMKIGLIRDICLEDCDPEVAERFEETVEIFRKGGADIYPVNLPNLKHAIATYYILATSEASSNLGRFDGIRYGNRAENKNLQELYSKSRNQGFGDEVKLRILVGTFALSSGYYDAYYLKAQKVRNLIRRQFRDAFAKVDCIALPVSPTTAFQIGENTADPVQMYLQDIFTVPANLAGIPGLSIPAGQDSKGMPIGLQLLTNAFCEETLLKIGHWFEINHSFPKAKLFF